MEGRRPGEMVAGSLRPISIPLPLPPGVGVRGASLGPGSAILANRLHQENMFSRPITDYCRLSAEPIPQQDLLYVSELVHYERR